MACTTTHPPGALCFACCRAPRADRQPARLDQSASRDDGRPTAIAHDRSRPPLTDRQRAHRHAMLAHLLRAR